MLMEAIQLCSIFKMYHLTSEPFNHARIFFLANKQKSIFILTKERNEHTILFHSALEVYTDFLFGNSPNICEASNLPDSVASYLNTNAMYLETNTKQTKPSNFSTVNLYGEWPKWLSQ